MSAGWAGDLFDRRPEDLPILGVPIQCRQTELVRHAATDHGVTLRCGPGVVASVAFVDELCRKAAGSGLPRAQAAVEPGVIHQEYGRNPFGGEETEVGLLYDLWVETPGPRTGVGPVVAATITEATVSPQPGRMAEPLRAPVGDRIVWAVGQWSDLLVANLLALQAANFARADTTVAPTASVHPTAVIERSGIGEHSSIGPYAVVTDSVIGSGATVEEHASIRASRVDGNSSVQTGALVHRSYVGPSTVVSFQTAIRSSVLLGRSTVSAPVVARSLIGWDVFLARGVVIGASTLNDSEVTIRAGDRSVPSGLRLLGCVVGNGARVGNGVHLPAGYEVPAGRYVTGRPIGRLDRSSPRHQPLVYVNRRFRPVGFASRPGR